MQDWLQRFSRNYTAEELKELKRIHLYGDEITEIPQSICELEKLEYLYLSNTQIKEIPATIYKLKNLRELDLSYNQIVELPVSITKLKNLEFLDICHNKFLHLPILGKLKNLYYLTLHTHDIFGSIYSHDYDDLPCLEGDYYGYFVYMYHLCTMSIQNKIKLDSYQPIIELL